jgi:outer membrane immunogenic protein
MGKVMKNSFLAGLGLVSLFAGPAMAADLPAKVPAVKVSPVYNWTGCYAGPNFGSVFVQQDWGAFGGDDGTGLVLGGQAGCNYQISTWVFGVQGDAAWSDASGTHTDDVTGLTDEWKKNMLSSVTGRFGYALDRWLVYGKGGVAWTHNRLNFSDLSIVGETRDGWVVGAGLEYAITNHVSMFFEYDFYDFGTRTVGFNTTRGSVPIDIREHEGFVKVGGNWKFGW